MPIDTLRPETCAWLLHVARRTLREALLEADGPTHPMPITAPPRPDDPALAQPARVFVTWRGAEDVLVGCIGTVAPQLPLEEAVARYSKLASMEDTRTPTPTASQWPTLYCSVSVLTAPVPMNVKGLEAITAGIVPGRDGVTLRCGHKRALLLPAVWENLPTATAFIEVLCQKAGIDPVTEGAEVEAETFVAIKFGEPRGGP